MCRSFMAVMAVALTLAASATSADDVDKSEEKAAKAREEYTSTLSAVHGEVLKLIEAKYAAERKRANPDLNKLRALKAEKESLEKGEMPKWIDAKTKDRITKNQAPLIAALMGLRKAYVAAKDDEKAAAVDKEISDLKRGGPAVVGKGKRSPKEVLARAVTVFKPDYAGKVQPSEPAKRGTAYVEKFAAFLPTLQELQKKLDAGTLTSAEVSKVANDMKSTNAFASVTYPRLNNGDARVGQLHFRTVVRELEELAVVLGSGERR